MKNTSILFIFCTLFITDIFTVKSYNKKIIEKICATYRNCKNIYETGTFQAIEIREIDSIVRDAGIGKHELFLDNVSKKIFMKYELKFPTKKLNKGGYNIIISQYIYKGLKEKNLFEGNIKDQQDIFININRHTSAFSLIYPELDTLNTHIFNQKNHTNIEIIEVLENNIPYYKIIKKYKQNIDKEEEEEEQKQNKYFFDSLGKPELANKALPKIIEDTKLITKIYWFRKDNNLLTKSEVSIISNTTDGIIHSIFKNTFNPIINGKIDKKVFKN